MPGSDPNPDPCDGPGCGLELPCLGLWKHSAATISQGWLATCWCLQLGPSQ